LCRKNLKREKEKANASTKSSSSSKALALGAAAVGIGRPYAWGLAAFGQPGVEAVLEILRRELRMIMRQAGTTSVDKITRRYVVARPGES
jgi:isopentenyl diphosphate isomerase/L-lactate dehydrogenase-like FMN-dependent dehydrogenase